MRRASRQGVLAVPTVVVLEGQARDAVPEGETDGVRVVHAGGSGDDAIVALIQEGVTHAKMTVVTADRGLRIRVQALGAEAVGPHWLHEKLREPRLPG